LVGASADKGLALPSLGASSRDRGASPVGSDRHPQARLLSDSEVAVWRHAGRDFRPRRDHAGVV